MKRFFTVLFTPLLFFIFSFSVFAQIPVRDSIRQQVLQQVDQRRVEESSASSRGFQSQVVAKQRVNNGPHFRFGENIVLTEDLVGDVYVAGGVVQIDSRITGDLLVAGGQVTLNGTVTEDIRVGAGNLVVNGTVGKNMSVGSGNVIFSKDSVVGGAVVLGSGESILDGTVRGNVWVGSGKIFLSGIFQSGVFGESGFITVGPSAVIQGDLNMAYAEQAEISDQADIQGVQDVHESEYARQGKTWEDRFNTFGEVTVAGVVVGLLMSLVTALVLVFLFTRTADMLSTTVIERPLPSLGWGVLYIVGAPILLIILLVTVLGAPLALFGGLFYLLDLMVAGYVVAYAGGRFVYNQWKFNWLKSRYAQVALGVVVLKLVGLIPVLGALVKFFVVIVGMGALAQWAIDWIRKEKKEDALKQEEGDDTLLRLSEKKSSVKKEKEEVKSQNSESSEASKTKSDASSSSSKKTKSEKKKKTSKSKSKKKAASRASGASKRSKSSKEKSKKKKSEKSSKSKSSKKGK